MSQARTMSQARQMAHLTKELSQAMEFRKSAIDAMREATTSLLAAYAVMRGEKFRDYRVAMQKFLSSLSRNVAAHRKAMAHQVAQTQKFLGAQARDVAAHRNATMNQIAHIGNARAKAASRLRSNLHSQADAMVTQAAAVVSQFADVRQKMAKRQKAALGADRQKLHKDMAAFVKSIHADRAKAQNIWSQFKLGRAA